MPLLRDPTRAPALAGHPEKRIRQLEHDFLAAEVSPSERLALEFARHISRASPLAGARQAGSAPTRSRGRTLRGLYRGTGIAGPIGSRDLPQLTVVGRIVNVAARVEALTRELGVDVLVTREVRDALDPASRSDPAGARRERRLGAGRDLRPLASRRGAAGRPLELLRQPRRILLARRTETLDCWRRPMARRLPPRLRTTLLVLFVIAVLPAFVVILRSAWTSWNESVEETSHEALEEASDAARHLGGSIDEARRVLHRLASDPAVQHADASACAPLLNDFLPLHPTFRNIGMIGAGGRLVCSARPPVRAVDFASFPLLREALASRTLLLRELPADTVTSRPILACILAVRDAAGKPIGLLFATLEFRTLAGLSIGARLPSGSTVTLVDGRGNVVVREPDSAAWVGRSIAGTALWTRLRAGDLKGKVDVSDVDGASRLFGFARIPAKRGRADAYLLVGVPPDTATARPRARMFFELAGLGSALLLLCGIAWFGIEAFVLRSVRSIRDAAVELASGRSGVRRTATPGAFELTQLGEAFDHMVVLLERSLTETRSALGMVRNSQSRLQTLSRALLECQEQERSQLARELHDEVGQALTAATLNLDALRGSTCDVETGRRVGAALDVVKQALDQVRDLSLDLHPSILDDLGLAPALRWYLTRQSERSGVAMNVEAKGLDIRLPRPIETACFRIAQEAVANALRHARPRRIDVVVERHGDEAELVVRDDGSGFEVEAARERARHSQSLGLIGMEERAELLGGRVEIDARPGAGTEVRAHLPIETSAVAQAVA